MARYKLSDKFVKELPAPSKGNKLYYDTEIKQLAYRITAKNARSFVLVYKRRGERERRYTFTEHDKPWKTAAAREEATRLLGKIADGEDPLAEKEAKREATRQRAADVGNLYPNAVTTFLKAYSKGRAGNRGTRVPRASTLRETARLLGFKEVKDKPGEWMAIKDETDDGKRTKKRRPSVKRLAVKWSDKRIDEITKGDVRQHLDAIADSGSGYEANRTYGALATFFKWAAYQDMVATSPLVGAWHKAPEQARDRALNDDEVRLFWKATGELGWPFGPLFRLLLLTGQRKSEAGDMTWKECDLDAAMWVIPTERAKNHREQMVPLSDEAVAILREARLRAEGAGYVWTTNGRTPPSGYSKAVRTIHTAMERIASEAAGRPVKVAHWTLHDLRRTVATQMNEHLAIDPHVVEAVLNHVSGSRAGVAGVYNRATYLKQKRAALAAWSRRVAELTTPRTDDRVSAVPVPSQAESAGIVQMNGGE